MVMQLEMERKKAMFDPNSGSIENTGVETPNKLSRSVSSAFS